MWFFSPKRGYDLIVRMRELNKYPAQQSVFQGLYSCLDILDAKATGLLTVNALFGAVVLGVLATPQLQSTLDVVAQFETVASAQLLITGLSAFLCMLVVRMNWQFMDGMPTASKNAEDYEDALRRHANVVDDRTRDFRLAWLLTFLAFVLTFSWWFFWAGLGLAAVVFVLWLSR